MIELKEKRQLTSKTFNIIGNTHELQAHIGHIHYENKLGVGDGEEGLRGIDWTLRRDDKKGGWFFQYHSFNPFIPDFADDWVEFRDLFGNKDQSIRYKATCGHIQGQLVEKIDGLTDVNAVVYPDAFGKGIDYIISFTRSAMQKIVRINNPKDYTEDLQFEFEIDFPDGANFDDINLTDSIAKNGKGLTFGKGEPSYIKDLSVWDSGEKRQLINYALSIKDGKKYLTKIIPVKFLQEAEGVVYTDTTTSYYAGAGDGYVWTDGKADWASARDAATGDLAGYTGTNNNIHSERLGSPNFYRVSRSFYPIDTSGLPDNAEISAATFYASFIGSGSNYGDVAIHIIQTSQASSTQLVTDDYNNVTFTSGGSLGINSYAAGYNATNLNATGLTWINKTGITYLGHITDKDLTNTATTGVGSRLYLQLYTSEQTGTGNDPYLSVVYTSATTFSPKVIIF